MSGLILTPNAFAAISRRAEHLGGPRPGLRVFPSDTRPGKLQVAMVAEPADGDQAVVEGRARVFCPPGSSAALTNSRLDARRDAEGRIEFVVRKSSAA